MVRSRARAYDHTGLPLHFDNQSIFKERFFLDKSDQNLFHDVITVFDHALTRLWSVDKTFRRNLTPRPRWAEASCNEGNETAFSGYSQAKAALDREIARRRKAEHREPMPAWQLSRDIRRTAKTLMQRAGVRPDISERVLAHVIVGVGGIYDKWGYLPEKRDALEKLAGLLGRILHPPSNSVVEIRRGGSEASDRNSTVSASTLKMG